MGRAGRLAQRALATTHPAPTSGKSCCLRQSQEAPSRLGGKPCRWKAPSPNATRLPWDREGWLWPGRWALGREAFPTTALPSASAARELVVAALVSVVI